MSVTSFIWEEDFPPVFGHTSVSFLKQCPGFEEAKSGDIQAALKVVNRCIKPNRILELKKRYPSAVTLPVITGNRLPEAFARQIDMKMHPGVYGLKEQNKDRKTLSAMERLLNKPCFSGKINKGENYIIVDDIITQGGTISSLRQHVINGGGSVSAIVALAFSTDSRIIAPDTQDVSDLINKFTLELITDILRKYKIADNVWELTRPQIRYLLRFGNPRNLIESIRSF